MTIGLIGATMFFFDTHFIGNIVNKFSHDINILDESVPFLFTDLGSVSFLQTKATIINDFY